MGKVHLSEVDYWPHNTCIYVTDFLGNNPYFADYLLGTLDLAAFNSGSAQPSLNRNFIYSMSLRVPGRDEQDRLVEMLRAIDHRISLLRETNATLEAIAQALFKSWFVDIDHPCAPSWKAAPPKAWTRPQRRCSPIGLWIRSWAWCRGSGASQQSANPSF